MASFKTVTFAALFALLQLTGPAAAAPAFSTNPATQRIVDHHGRERYFHGTNVVEKGRPYHPSTGAWNNHNSFVAKDMALLQELGLNAIRLGTMWDGIEPQRGRYNMTYLAVIHGIVQEASTYGIHSLLDMHQDVFSPKFCGEGFPTWFPDPPNMSTFPWPLQAAPFNRTKDDLPVPGSCGKHPWSTYYPTLATSEAFQNLYDNVHGLRDSWSMVWQTIARSMRSLGDAVLGYELINEPWAGDVWRDPLLMIPGVADKQNLQGFYEAGQAAIRAVDTEHQLYFEPVTWDDFGVGFTKVPGGDAWRNKSVLSYHFYVPPDFSIPIQFGARAKDMKRLGSAGMLTEFFAQDGLFGTKAVPPEEVLNACDDNKQSWLYWQYWGSLFRDDGSVIEKLARRVARTYPQIVAGAADVIKFNNNTAAFTLRYAVAAGVSNTTSEIFVPKARHYPSGFHVAVSADNAVASAVQWWAAGTNMVAVSHDASLPIGTLVTVQITRR